MKKSTCLVVAVMFSASLISFDSFAVKVKKLIDLSPSSENRELVRCKSCDFDVSPQGLKRHENSLFCKFFKRNKLFLLEEKTERGKCWGLKCKQCSQTCKNINAHSLIAVYKTHLKKKHNKSFKDVYGTDFKDSCGIKKGQKSKKEPKMSLQNALKNKQELIQPKKHQSIEEWLDEKALLKEDESCLNHEKIVENLVDRE